VVFTVAKFFIEVMVSGLGDEFSPGVAGVVDDVVVGVEDEI
jgi:hypothetical protein